MRLFQGAGAVDAGWKETLPCMRRFDPATMRVVRVLRHAGGWRYGFGNGYQAEQTTFAFSLWRRVARDFDILHVQDPNVALVLGRLNRSGLSKPRVILGHGTDEEAAMLRKFTYLQHLAPCRLEEYLPYKPERQLDFAIPNFVDTTRFQPGPKSMARKQWALPGDATIFLCVAAIKRFHKRIDFLIREFASFVSRTGTKSLLAIAGAREADTDEICRLGADLLQEKVVFLQNVPRERIPSIYQACDVFVLASLDEMLPVALLEAMATGMPAVCNHSPVMRWMIGDAGLATDLGEEGSLASALQDMTEHRDIKAMGCRARERAETLFSEAVVVRQIEEMYRQVLEA